MPRKPSKKPVTTKDRGFFEGMDAWLDHYFIGPELIINADHTVVGRVDHALKLHVTKMANSIINKPENKAKRYKFGKTGFAPNRSDQRDYRGASYTTMYLLYQSDSISNVETMERYYSTKYTCENLCDNDDCDSRGVMRSGYGKYYLYMVI